MSRETASSNPTSDPVHQLQTCGQQSRPHLSSSEAVHTGCQPPSHYLPHLYSGCTAEYTAPSLTLPSPVVLSDPSHCQGRGTSKPYSLEPAMTAPQLSSRTRGSTCTRKCAGRYTGLQQGGSRGGSHAEEGEEEGSCDGGILTSLESLSLSEHLPAEGSPPLPPPTCRQEALWEDITVDDLAGYMDQLLYLPRPMSDMAELMYA